MQSLPSFDLILFGGTGDLAMRKLLPALYRRSCGGPDQRRSPASSARRAASCRAMSTCEQVRASLRDAPRRVHSTPRSGQQFAERLDYVRVDAQNDGGLRTPGARCCAGSESRVRVVLPFDGARPVRADHRRPGAALAGDAEVARRAGKAARARRRLVRRDQRARRHAFSPSSRSFASITTSARRRCRTCWRCASAIRCSSRCGGAAASSTCRSPSPRRSASSAAREFYDQTGALRDMVQNHLLQLLCIIAMEPPASGEADADARREAESAARAAAARRVATCCTKTVRGQYKAGAVERQAGRRLSRREGVPKDSTHRNVRGAQGEIETWRWAGVPFYLRTGKRLQEKLAEIVDHVRGRAALASTSGRTRRTRSTGWSSSCSRRRASR